MAEYGFAIDGITDTGLTWGSVGGLKNLGNSIARRLTTQEGSLFYDLGYGFDVRQMLNGPIDAQTTADAIGKIEFQSVQDERIVSARATLTKTAAADSFEIQLILETSDSQTFTLVLSVNSLTVELLTVEPT